MRIFVLLLLGVVIINRKSALGICTEQCNEPTLIYDSLKCSPEFRSSDDCCPFNYNCSSIEEKSASKEQKCYFEGKVYNIGDRIIDAESYENCKVGCFCESQMGDVNKADFTCSALDCPEWLGYNPDPGCHFKYKLGECCQVGQVCTESNRTCLVNGQTHKIGEKFSHPTEKCTDCICDESFTGEFKGTFCKKSKCIEEISNQKKVYKFCAPSYISLYDCCPRGWFCPKKSDQIKRSGATSKNKCKFGTKLLNIGDTFSRTHGKGKLSCKCRIPPYLTCIQNPEYPLFGDD